MRKGVLIQLNISAGGMPKLPIDSARVTKDGVAGDWQINRKYHGGPDRAVCLYSEELHAWLGEQGIAVLPGEIGENFTTRGIDLMSLKPGARLRVGGCVIELTEVRDPCRNLNKWHPRLLATIKGHSGWVARVIVDGDVRPGDSIELLEETNATV